VELLISVVRYENPDGHPRAGVCSAYLAETPLGQAVTVAVHPAREFRPPEDPAKPMIMIGPGTGLAPFLGFLNDRRRGGEGGKNWLLFGDQREATDFYFRDELMAMRSDGLLSRLDVAFSRDQRAKIYVQDRMHEHGAEFWKWLQDGAHVYVCGDASRMAKDVDQALREIVAHYGSMSQDDATAYVRQLAADQRYQRHVY
jgi:sulfite reductase alpha subunit-like flavoprotein